MRTTVSPPRGNTRRTERMASAGTTHPSGMITSCRMASRANCTCPSRSRPRPFPANAPRKGRSSSPHAAELWVAPWTGRMRPFPQPPSRVCCRPPTRRSPHPVCASSQATTTCSHTAAHLRKRRFSIPCSSSRIERLPGELVFGHESCSGGIGDPRTARGIVFRACVQPSFPTPRSPVQPCMTNQVS